MPHLCLFCSSIFRLTYMREWTSVVRELCRIQHLDSCVLYTIEWSDYWVWLTRLTTKIKGDFGIVEPETNMVLVRRYKRDGRILVVAERDRECFHIEDTTYRGATRTSIIGLKIGLVPRNAEWLVR